MDLAAAVWSGLPLEILEKVLSFLPVPDLCKYCSVSKTWNGIICNPKFAAIHAHNAARQDASFIVVHYRRNVMHMSSGGVKNEGWCFLDLNTRRWYSIDNENDRYRDASHGILAMDGGLVCQNSKTHVNIVVVRNPIGFTARELPSAPIHCTSESYPKLDMVVDRISRNFRIYLINHLFYDTDLFRNRRYVVTTPEYILKVLNDPLIRVFDSVTARWQSSTNPSCISTRGVDSVGNASKVEIQGLLFVLLGAVDFPFEEQLPLWKYNLVEDAWEKLPVLIPSVLCDRELIVSANRLFLVAWYSKRNIGIFHDVDWVFEVSEVRISDNTRETLFELLKADVVTLLDINSGVENVDSAHPKVSVIGFGKSLLFMSNSSGNSVAFDVVTGKWDPDWPQNPLGRLPNEDCCLVGKHMDILLTGTPF